MYVKVKNGNVEKYPYTLQDLKKENPATSFPKDITEEVLASYNVFLVEVEEMPDFDARLENVSIDSVPSLTNDVWVLSWTKYNNTSEQIAQIDEQTAINMRIKRDGLLLSSDWTQVADAPVDAESWATYRQALRDITTHANWPNLADEDWPTKP